MRGVDDSPYQWCGESTATHIYGELFKKYLVEDGVNCIFFLSFFLLMGAKPIFFSQISTPRINDTRSQWLSVSPMRGVDDSPYQWCGESTAPRIWWVFQKVFRRGRGCLHILGDRNKSTNVSISKLIIGTKPKRFDLVRLLPEQKQNVSICSKNF